MIYYNCFHFQIFEIFGNLEIDFGDLVCFINPSVRLERHEWDTNDTSATKVKNFDLDNETSENIFWHPYIGYMANERLQDKEQFDSKN